MEKLEYSVALCTFNGAAFLEEQLLSILNQTIPPSEILISDDGSSDNTVEIAECVLSKTDIPYSIVINKQQMGVTKNFCSAISKCTYPIVFTSDQDDVWVDNKAERILETFNQNPNAKLVFSNGFLVDENLKYLGVDMWDEVRITKRMLKEAKWFDYLLNRFLVTGATMALKKELYDSSDVIPERWYHDAWFAFKASIYDGLVACDQRLIKYRQHSQNVVGMHHDGLIKNVKTFFANIKPNINRRKEFAEERKRDIGSIKNSSINSMSETQANSINHCLKFWGDYISFYSETKKTKRLRMIVCFLFNGDYKMYRHGLFSVIRDFFLSFA